LRPPVVAEPVFTPDLAVRLLPSVEIPLSTHGALLVLVVPGRHCLVPRICLDGFFHWTPIKHLKINAKPAQPASIQRVPPPRETIQALVGSA
jgi:hypothetical protein